MNPADQSLVPCAARKAFWGRDGSVVPDGSAPADQSPAINLGQPGEDAEVDAKNCQVVELSVRVFRELGLLHEINRLILHPLGLAMSVNIDPATNVESFGPIWNCLDDPEGIAYGENYIDAAKAASVATLIEARGRTRIPALGYVVQPVDPRVKQLHMTVKEPFAEKVGPAGEYDQGEDRP
jgi:hypothetical protein